MSLRKCSTKKPGSKLSAMIRGPRLLRLHEPAAPLADALHDGLQVEPRLVAVEQGLADADHVRGDQDLVDHLGVLAGAGAALVDDRLAHRSRTAAGRPRRRPGSPPIMIDSRASLAPTSPPETGASTEWTPLAFAASAISTASAGSLVVMSTRTEPDFAPARAPCSPRITSRTSLGKADDREDHVGRFGDLLRGGDATLAPLAASGVGLRLRPVEDRRLIAGVDQVAAHRRAHDAGADPADPRLPGLDLQCHYMDLS